LEEYWVSLKICIRNGYTITDASMWKDYIDLLRYFGKDTNNPKYVCPTDLKTEHDILVAKKNERIKREKLAKARQKAIETANALKRFGKRPTYRLTYRPSTT